ncbi:hypothetical protein [Endozoicomonas elysicola]|uniref:Uncharacterized protein n=1 Tax=Endozoicomonas elysicola TaxID=305900 RepID=A0A081KEA8_9GAMM|nr:hypothetical protein [Endozoicomonas elysicola]KEI72484.1 hypothetical protein GV64_18675 [Endozoicomonas elysicola]
MVASSRIPPKRRYTPLKATHPHSHRIKKRHYRTGKLKGKRVIHIASRKQFVKGIKRLFSLSKVFKSIRNRKINHLEQAVVLPPKAKSSKIDRRIGNMVLAIIRGDLNQMVKRKNSFRTQVNRDAFEQGKGPSAGADDTRLLFMEWAESIKNTPLKEQIRQLLKTRQSRFHKNAIAFMSIYGGLNDYTPYQADIVSSYNLLMRCLVDVLLPSEKDLQFITLACRKDELTPSAHTELLLKEILAIQPPPPAPTGGG